MTPLKLVITDEIDLLNVSFDKELAPDRISSRGGLKELQRFSPLRRYAVMLLFRFLVVSVPLFWIYSSFIYHILISRTIGYK